MILRGSVGMFISPKGEILLNQGSHIQAVICDPEKFGLTSDEINIEYRKYGEPVGMEGKARGVLLDKIIRNGWIRLRRYPNRQWSVTVAQLDPVTLSSLENWGLAILEGISGVKEADPYMPVVITKLLPVKETVSTVGALG
jgi:hypothetical protein